MIVRVSIWTFFVLTLFVQSCSCSWHLKKVENKCGLTSKTDTVFVLDTVIVPEVHTDTIISLGHDTVYINKDRLQIKILRLKGDSIFVDGKCKTDTMYIEVPVAVTNNEFKPEPGWQKWIGWILFLVLLIAAWLFRKR